MSVQTFSLTTRIARPAPDVFAWHERPGALARLCPPWERVELVAATGGVRDGARVTVRNKFGPFWQQWEVEHRDYIPGVQFRDVQVSGPFARWEHLHRIAPDGADACTLTDEISYRLPGGPLGQWAGGRFVAGKLAQLFAWRHATTKADLESTARYGAVAARRILIAGGSGLVGRALEAFLQTQGHRVVRLVRRPARGDSERTWNPSAGSIDPVALAGIDAVVNLAGESIAAGRWSAARRDAILRSRIDATRTLVAAIARAAVKPAVLLNASAVGIYGDCGDAVLPEAGAPGGDFLAEVCRVWEAEAQRAADQGVRPVLLRFGVVLTPAGGALGKLLPLFNAGLGGRVGRGTQWMSWVSCDDVVGAIYHALLEPRCRGPLNVVAPEPVTNSEFTQTLARTLHRPAVLPVPAIVLRAVFGEMADATLLASTRVVPAALLATGYRFRHPQLAAALADGLGRQL